MVGAWVGSVDLVGFGVDGGEFWIPSNVVLGDVELGSVALQATIASTVPTVTNERMALESLTILSLLLVYLCCRTTIGASGAGRSRGPTYYATLLLDTKPTSIQDLIDRRLHARVIRM
jgi:hypothetical protein